MKPEVHVVTQIGVPEVSNPNRPFGDVPNFDFSDDEVGEEPAVA
ncbi:hypothetical protein AMC99_02439 [Altererythrobacter epoxidivorans]|uniref:Uncharacterized protein n=1 Tax=Altererythrobacter epoxidivorans TaxID=361183 RepID=A0A0M4MXM9_9SPHN|nr:hypothetical protein AMC99_02439 [Altererythrobacter epoxidivorans]